MGAALPHDCVTRGAAAGCVARAGAALPSSCVGRVTELRGELCPVCIELTHAVTGDHVAGLTVENSLSTVADAKHFLHDALPELAEHVPEHERASFGPVWQQWCFGNRLLHDEELVFELAVSAGSRPVGGVRSVRLDVAFIDPRPRTVKLLVGGADSEAKDCVLTEGQVLFRMFQRLRIGGRVVNIEVETYEPESEPAGSDQASGLLLVYDTTCRRTFEHAARCLQELQPRSDHAAQLDVTLVANSFETDDEPEVSQKEGFELARRYDLHFIETCAQTGHKVDEAFTGTAERGLKIGAGKSAAILPRCLGRVCAGGGVRRDATVPRSSGEAGGGEARPGALFPCPNGEVSAGDTNSEMTFAYPTGELGACEAKQETVTPYPDGEVGGGEAKLETMFPYPHGGA